MAPELFVFIVMLATFIAGLFWWKLPTGVALILASIAGALAAGEGIPVRHLIEGMFGFLDPILIVATAMIFMKSVEASGALATLSSAIMLSLYRWPAVLMVAVVFFIMFPGMLTGLSSACILTTGALVVPSLLALGIPVTAVGALVAFSAVLGEVAPPINLPVMIIGGGVDMPYVGFVKPLAMIVIPLAIVTGLYFRVRFLRAVHLEDIRGKLPPSVYASHGVKLFVPFLIVIGLMVVIRSWPETVPDIGAPLSFLIGAAATVKSGERYKPLAVAQEAMRAALPVLAILVGVGVFVQILTLTGVRGFLAVSALRIPETFLAAGVGVAMPAFGSAYAASSVLGVPLVYVFLGKSEILVTSALSLMASVGDLMPPASLLCVLSAQLVGEKNHWRILRAVLPLAVLALMTGVFLIMLGHLVGDIML